MSQKVNLSSVTLGVVGMTCGSCVQSIEQRIKSLPGVINIKVSLEQKNAIVIFDHSQQSPESLSEAIEDMGFESRLSESSKASNVSTDTQLISTSSLTPTAQQEALEKLSQTEGVLDVSKSAAQMGLTVTFVPSLTSLQQLSDVVASLTPLEIPTPSSPRQKSSTLSPSHTMGGGVSLLKLRIEGMTCHSCTTTIEGKIGKLKGIEKIKGASALD